MRPVRPVRLACGRTVLRGGGQSKLDERGVWGRGREGGREGDGRLAVCFEEARPVLGTRCSNTAESGPWVARGKAWGKGERGMRDMRQGGGGKVSAEDG